MKRALAFLALVGLSGCAYPTSTIVQVTAPGHVRVAQAPVGAAVEVDGRILGYRTKARTDVFDVEPGRHVIRLTNGAHIMSNKEYFVGSGSTVDIKAQ